MADFVITPTKAPTCPQDAMDYTVESDGEGYGATKASALNDARDQADSKGRLQPACPSDCSEARTEMEPPYDTRRPEYMKFGAGWKCKVSRTVTWSLACVRSETQTSIPASTFKAVEQDGTIALHDFASVAPVAYYSSATNTIFVHPEERERFAKVLGVRANGNSWSFQLPTSCGSCGTKDSEDGTEICAEEQDWIHWNPLAKPDTGDFRVFTKKCVDQTVTQRCAVLFSNPPRWWAFSMTYGRCTGETQYYCFETWGKVGEADIYTDPNCTQRVDTMDIEGWFCLQI